MNDVVDALDATGGTTCLVGAGGKKTTLYALAGRLDRAVLTATVRIPIFDREVAAVRVAEDPVAAIDEIASSGGEDAVSGGEESEGDAEPTGGAGAFPLGLVPERERDDRYRGYDPAVVDEIGAAHDGPVLVKADGARTRLLKAPNEREPQVPAGADRVIPVASVGAVGEPLTAETVHRPERVAAITDAAVGDEITPELVGRVLAHERGGLKGIPDDATAIPLVNAVDDADDEATAREIARVVHERADVSRVVLARMIEGEIVGVVE
jgi:probable selenium-dependent hydroxylase accessory protein YqeC